MADTRLNSMHFTDLRREEFRVARERLLGARGCLTLAGEKVGDWLGFDAGSSAGTLLPGARFLLFEPGSGDTFALHTGLNTVGRYEDNDITLDGREGDRYVSRRHCTLLVHARGSCELHDTASRNGTYVNHRKVDFPVRLSPGDRIRISKRQLVLTTEEDLRAGGDDRPDSRTLSDLPNAIG